VLHAWATEEFDDTDDGIFGLRGKQKIENTGMLTRKRMETFDKRGAGPRPDLAGQGRPGRQAVLLLVQHHRHPHLSHPQKKYLQQAVDEGRAEEDVVRAKMLEHDEHVGALLAKLKELGIDDNTIVIYSTDNGNELMLWPDGGYAPFRGEKGTTWEGGVRVPCLIKWPGQDPGRHLSNGMQNHEDLYLTLAEAAARPASRRSCWTVTR
jgi:arylsulfatase A-like enzyme